MTPNGRVGAIGIAIAVCLACGYVVSDVGRRLPQDLHFRVAALRAFESEATAIRAERATAQVTVRTSSDFGLWWITPEDFAIINDDSPAMYLDIPGCEAAPDVRPTKQLASLQQRVDRIMLADGFRVNFRNSSRSLQDDRFYDYVRAYERDNVKAVLTLSPDCAAGEGEQFHFSLAFAYTVSMDANAAVQAPILRDLGLHSDVIIHIGKRTGDLALFNVNYRRTGHYVVARLVGGHWMQLIAGQDGPTCSRLDSLGIPRSFMGCYNPD